MSDSISSPNSEQIQPQGTEAQSALFANLIIQHSSLAMMLMGQSPSPQGERPAKDLSAARMFIDQIEMIEVKTRGNLTKEETDLLKQTLMGLRMAFVESVEEGQAEAQKHSETPAREGAAPATGAPISPPAEESHKKFTKKY